MHDLLDARVRAVGSAPVGPGQGVTRWAAEALGPEDRRGVEHEVLFRAGIDPGGPLLQRHAAPSNCWQPMTRTADEFLRRLSLHILPRGFVRVRAFGFLTDCHRQEKLARIRSLLPEPPPTATSDTVAEMPEARSAPRCPHCGQAAVYPVRRTHRPRVAQLIAHTYGPALFDTS